MLPVRILTRKIKSCATAASATSLVSFRTDNGCGWGVKTLEKIKKGQFVVQYVGEVITSEEAERRGKDYDAAGRTYLFDLDFNSGDDNPYTVSESFHVRAFFEEKRTTVFNAHAAT